MSYSEVTINAPPGRLGIQLMDFNNTTVVSSVSLKSPLTGMVFQGDSIAVINGVDVHDMNTSEILEVFNKFSRVKKEITIVRHFQDSKGSDSAKSRPQSNSSSSREQEHDRHHSKNASCKTSPSSKQLVHGVRHHSVPSSSNVKHGTVEYVSDVDRRPFPLDISVDSDHAKALPNTKSSNTKRNKCINLAINSEEDKGPDESSSTITFAKSKISTNNGLSESPLPNRPPVPVGVVFDDSISIKASTKAKLLYNSSSSTQSSPCFRKRMPPPSASNANEERQGHDAPCSTSEHSMTCSNSGNPRNVLSASVASPERSTPLSSRFPNSSVPEEAHAPSNQNAIIDSSGEIVADAVLVNEDDIYDAEVMSEPQPSLREETKAPQVIINQMYASSDDTSRCCENKSYAIGIPLIVFIIAMISIIVGITVGTKHPVSNTFDVDNDNSHPSWDDHSQNSDLTYNSATHQYYFSNGTLYVGPDPSTFDQSNEKLISTIPVSGNEKCENAFALIDLPASFTGRTATDSWSAESYFEDDVCRTSDGLKGVWYSLNSDKQRIISLEYDLKPQSTYEYYESVLAIFTGSCGVGNLNCIKTVQGSAMGESMGGIWDDMRETASHNFIAKEGDSYLFLLSGDYTGRADEYTFKVTEFDIPINDRCIDATNITSFPAVVRGNMKGATEDDGGSYCMYKKRGVWYQFTGHGTIVRLEYHQPDETLEGNAIAVAEGTCDSLSCLLDEEIVIYESSHLAATEFFAEEGVLYTVFVYGETFESSGQFQFNVTEHSLPSNDKCNGATEVKVSPSNPFSDKGHSTLGATPEDLLPSCDWYSFHNDARGVWYKIIGNGSVMKLEYQLYSEATGYSLLVIFTGSCESLSCSEEIQGAAHYDWGKNDKISYDLVTNDGETYWIWISGENAKTTGEYDFTVSEL